MISENLLMDFDFDFLKDEFLTIQNSLKPVMITENLVAGALLLPLEVIGTAGLQAKSSQSIKPGLNLI